MILAQSPFSRLELLEDVYQAPVRPTVESLVGAEYRMSYALARLGDRREAFELEVRAALGDVSQMGEVLVTRRDEALIGRR